MNLVRDPPYRWFPEANSSHLHSTQPNYRTTTNISTKTNAHVPLSLFDALRLFLCADSRSGVHITIVFHKSHKLYGFSTIWPKLYGFGFFLVEKHCLRTRPIWENRDCEQFLHFCHAKIVTIDTQLLWRSMSCTKAFNVTKIHEGIAMNHFFQSAYTQEIVCSW
jgi:hypothetical protein